MKIRKGDKVVVLTGKDRGKEGLVTRALPEVGKVVVEGVNVAKRHQRPTSATQQGGIIDKLMPLDVSNVAVISPADGKATRVGFRFDDKGNKIRICKRTGADL
ncbi:MAG: 50S ribosomal protein L24 [Actinobacteria bacterium]|nr:50S ribosomal protein L24 [Actinomycetota bacterium]